MMTVMGITLHWYGLLIGLSILVSFFLIQYQAKRLNIPLKELETAAVWALVGGILGARLYHVVTDFYLYQADLITALYIWRGGLSIIGAIIGGLMSLSLARKLGILSLPVSMLLDISIFGLPIAQAIGRVGNYINQELYGLPTNLPWGIYISPSQRPAEFLGENRFHPLFAYEGIAMLVFAVWVWWSAYREPRNYQVGSGRYFSWYVLYYCLVRFGLDFLRLDKTMAPLVGLGWNQVVLMVIFLITASWSYKKFYAKAK